MLLVPAQTQEVPVTLRSIFHTELIDYQGFPNGSLSFNPSSIFLDNNGTPHHWVRNDTSVAEEFGSRIYLCRQHDDRSWRPISEAPQIFGQDPVHIDDYFGKRLVSSVTVEKSDEGATWYRDYYTVELTHDQPVLTPLVSGPKLVKGFYPLILPDQSILLLMRPSGRTDPNEVFQGQDFGGGEIWFSEISRAQFESGDFGAPRKLNLDIPAGSWPGINNARVLPNGLVGIVGHLGYFISAAERRYDGIAFAFDKDTGKATPYNTFGTRRDFPETPWRVQDEQKPNDLKEIAYYCGYTPQKDGTATLLCGLGDFTAGMMQRVDPLNEFLDKF